MLQTRFQILPFSLQACNAMLYAPPSARRPISRFNGLLRLGGVRGVLLLFIGAAQRKRNRRKQSETERTLFGVWGGVLHACSQLLPVFLQACNVMLEHSNIGRRGIKQMELNETKWSNMNAVLCMLPVASILASSMQYNASCFPVHTLGRSNGVRPPCGMQLTVMLGQSGVFFSALFSACF